MNLSPEKKQDASAGFQSPAKIDINARTLNMYLEEAMQFTVRDQSSSSFFNVGSSFGSLLNSSNISAAIFERIGVDNGEIHSAVLYLASCYKRFLLKEMSLPEVCQDEFKRYYEQPS